MGRSNPETYNSGHLHSPLPRNAILIIGAGHFGKRAAMLLSQDSEARLFVIDKDRRALYGMTGCPVEKILCDGIHFLAENFTLLNPSNTIIPAIPVNLASEWFKTCLADDFEIKSTEVPDQIKPLLPHTWPGREGSLLVSYADFRCPDDCPEPASYCTVTGKRRETPLYELLRNMSLSNYRVHIIKSRQLAPGLGGYKVDDLRALVSRVKAQGGGRWLVGTACRCHGTLAAMEIRAADPKQKRSRTKPFPTNSRSAADKAFPGSGNKAGR